MGGPRYTHDTATHNRRAAMEVVPWLIERFRPHTIIDVGCGLGTWAAVFAQHGCEVLGIDTEDVAKDLLEIPPQCFRVADFELDFPICGHFDLAVCLEVVEHLSPEAGQRLVERVLPRLADVILFSAAVPGQAGDGHLNEQWPAYWEDFFSRSGFMLDDAVRWQFWNNAAVDWWYRQNMFVARRGAMSADGVKAVVHPRLLEKKCWVINDFYKGRIPLRTAALIFGRAILNRLRPFTGRKPDS